MLRIMMAATAALVLAVPAQAQTAEENALIQRAATRGQTIYAYDQAAWHGTDDLLRKIKDPQKRIGGWIVDGPASNPTLIFFDQNADNPSAVYIAEFRDNKLVSSRVLRDGDDRSISPERKRMIAARRTALTAWQADPASFTCSDKPVNTVVLPPERPGGPILVYILTPQTEMGKIPFGGHFLVEVDASGQAGKPRTFTKACLNLPLPPKSEKAAAVGVSHLLDTVPTEIHVFSSYAAKMPVVVMIEQPQRNFWIENGAIRLMKENELRGE